MTGKIRLVVRSFLPFCESFLDLRAVLYGSAGVSGSADALVQQHSGCFDPWGGAKTSRETDARKKRPTLF